MSIFFDFDVGPTGRRFRRAVEEDKYDIQKIYKKEETEPLFGKVDIGALIELSTLAICMINEKKEVTGFMAFADHPHQVVIHSADWEVWMRNMFHCFYLSRNTLFLHFICCMDDVLDYFVKEALVSVFINDAYLKHILLLVVKECPKECYTRYKEFRNIMTYQYSAKCIGDENVGMFMFVARSQDFCPKLKLRRAVEEDNDEIVEILDKKCKRLKELYGEYYIAELIGHHPDSKRKIIVAEQRDKSVAGVMCLNSEINYVKLQMTYDLLPFYGLMKSTPLDRENLKRSNKLLSTFGDPVMRGEWTPFSRMVKMKSVHHEVLPEKETEIIKPTVSRVNFDFNRVVNRRSVDMHNKRHSEDSAKYVFKSGLRRAQLTSASNMSVVDLLEGDSFDYEIVNISNNLLIVPDQLPYYLNAETDSVDIKDSVWSVDSDISTTHIMSGSASFTKIPKLTSIPETKYLDDRNDEMDEMLIKTTTFDTKTTVKKGILNKNKTKESTSWQIVGAPNAFMIELFSLRDDIHESHAFDLLEAAFEVMNEYDYCIIKIPLGEPSFSLLQHFCYVPANDDSCTDSALYVAHRNSIFGKLRVREAEMADIPQISQVMHDVEGKDTIWTVEDTLMRGKEHRVFVLLCGHIVVGFGIIEPPDQIEFIRTKFLIECYHMHKYHTKHRELDCGFTTLKIVMAYRIFEQHFRFFARDMMRLSGCNSLLWLTAYRNKWMAYKANILASMMIPLLPRKNEIDFYDTIELKRITLLNREIFGFTTWFLSKKFCSVPMHYVNARIVVVGASCTALAFLNRLLFSESCTYLLFTNVTLISPTAVPHVRRRSSSSESMFLRYNSSSDKYVKSVPYTYYVNIVRATLTSIHKKNKYVTVSTGGRIYYDYLCLMFGKQYQPPDYFKEILATQRSRIQGQTYKYNRLDIPKTPEPIRITSDFQPINVFIVNNFVDSSRAIGYVLKLAKNHSFDYNNDYKIIVYGATIHAYCCLYTLLEINVPTEKIVFVEPFPSEDKSEPRISLFCNKYVDQTIQEVLHNLNITVYRSYYFQDWTLGPNNTVSHVTFLSHYQKISLECNAFFYYGKTGISPQAYIALNKSGIAYNDGILIDHEFCTKHHNVYAAGPATRYYGKYLADDKKHEYYDSYEIGAKLGETIRDNLDPLFKPKKKKDSESKDKNFCCTRNSSKCTNESTSQKSDKLDEEEEDSADIPVLKRPLVTCCILPGGLQYLDVRPPGKKRPHYYVQSLHYNGYVLETYKKGYFKLHLDSNLVVDGVTCLSPVTYSLEKFKHLYGRSTNVLNNVYVKFVTKRIDDFYDYFRQSWAQFLYIDHVQELLSMVKELCPKVHNIDELNTRLSPMDSFEAIPRPVLTSVKSQLLNTISPDFQQSSYMDAIMSYVFDWIEQHEILVPMYLHPSKRQLYMGDIHTHPAFQKKRTRIAKLMKMIMQ